jgi:polysaccharide deacetylase 2 family uncharacterized protein YibQ
MIILVQAGIIMNLNLRYKKAVRKKEPVKQAIPRVVKKKIAKEKLKVGFAKVALVIDDFGYSLKNISILDSIAVPMTLSILPGHSYSQTVAEYAHQKGWEVILHLPLEPQKVTEYARPEQDTILTSMKKTEVLQILSKQLSSVGYIVGVSNHMGSKATASEKLMLIIFEQLRDKNLFFLDSIVTPASVGKKLAKTVGVGFVTRDVFLDNESDYGYIAGQFDQLITLAKRKGKAVGIAHDRKVSLTVLADILSRFDSQKEDVEFVPVSALAQRP